ncbi:sugar ABC transporter substrate-binding protein [Streptomyces sp. ISID311]|uniref:sugar ABC transporter substrate-binding protein n=1 Tax=Streptomyces sp. ISID311 TaxID=2601673 RepID=UPI0011BD2FCF|nr:sugar ABC transporter substrate-binding protein [Streptomyces sp. ISID311]TXC99896.1 sugar ABC transporter substrate-binding protein [Streptomyces sp. ISID311]
MKTVQRTRGALVALGLCLTLALAACGSNGNGGGSGGHHKTVVGYSIATGGQPILNKAAEAFVATGKHYGWDVKTLDAQLDAGKQAQDIDQFVAQGVDAIVFIAAGSNEAILPSIKRAKKAGVKVLGLSAVLDPKGDVAPLDANLDGGGMYNGSDQLAKLAAERTRGKGNALGVGLGIPVAFLQIQVEQYKKRLASYAPDVKWIDTVENPTDDITGAEHVVSEALTAHRRDVQTVLAYNDSSAVGAAVALKNAGVKDVFVAGVNGDSDAAEAVADGRVTATIDLTPWRQGMMAAAMVKGLLAGDHVPKWISVPVELYTKKNVGNRLDWDKAISQIKSGKLTCKTGGCPAEITDLP